MSTYTKFNDFVRAAMEKEHNCSSDVFTAAFTNAANPPLVTDSILSDLTEISYTNLGSRNFVLNSSSQTGGVYTLSQNDLSVVASGAVATFRYVAIYNNTAPGNPLVAFWDSGGDITLTGSDSVLLDFATNITFTVT